MARRFRWWPKKRGARRTGSPFLGTVGEAMFFGLLLLLGAGSLAILIGSQLTSPSPELLRFGFGFWLMVLVLASFMLIGGGGLIYTLLQFGTSAERRSALARHAANFELLNEALPRSGDYPTLPSDTNLTNSPGIKLAYRLPTAQSPVWHISAAAIFGFLWNGLAIVLAVVAVNRHIQARPDWFLTVLVLPCFAVGVWALKHFFKQMSFLAVLAPTIVEISGETMRPGQTCDLFLSQSGHVNLRSLQLLLVCDEEATFRQGTDLRVETHRVFEMPILNSRSIELQPGQPFEHRDTFQIPESAMHSFHSPHNRVMWHLVVRGRPDGRPAFERSFPLVVYPSTPASPAKRDASPAPTAGMNPVSAP